MQKRSALLLILVLLAGGCSMDDLDSGSAYYATDKDQSGNSIPERRISLNGVWKFAADPDEIGYNQSWHEEGYNDSAWREITVPGSWNFLYRDTPFPSENHDYDGPAWYRTSFNAPDIIDEGHVILSFQAVCYQTTVWLNGKLLGVHEGDFLPFEYDVSEKIKPGEKNALALYVETINSDSRLTIPPAIMRYDYWIYSGIHRDVFLELSNKFKIYDIFARGKPSAGRGEVAIEAWILNTDAETVRISAKASVRQKNDDAISAESIEILEIPSGSIAKAEFRLNLLSPKLWSPESPNLYTASVELSASDDPVTVSSAEISKYNADEKLPPRATLTPIPTQGLDAAGTDFGIRLIEVRGNEIYLNGEKLIFRGVNRHDEYPMLGRTIPEELCRKDLIMMKRAGMNTLRTAHYPNDPKIYRLADEMGLLVFEEIPATGLRPWEMWSGKVKLLADDSMRRMVIRDRNHPSIVVWGVGNEFEPWVMSSYSTPLYRMVKKIDPTRLISYNRAMYDLIARDCESDLVILNIYWGWYAGRVEDTSLFLDVAHTLFPKKPIVIGEFGADAERCRRTNTEPSASPHFTEDYQVWHLLKTWEIIESKNYMSGGIIWVFADFLTPKREYIYSSQIKSDSVLNPLPYHNMKGIVDKDRVPKNAYLTVMGMFGEGPLHDLAISTFDSGGYPVPGADVEIFLEDGTLACAQKTDDEGRVVLWHIPGQEYRVLASSEGMSNESTILLDADKIMELTLQ